MSESRTSVLSSASGSALLADADSRYSALADNGQAILFEIARNGRYTFISANVEAITGHPAEALIGRSFRGFVHPEDVSRVLLRVRAAVVEDAGELPILEYRAIHADGSIHWHRSVMVPLREANGRVRAVAGSALDITDLKQTEAELRQESALTGLLVRLATAYINLPSSEFEAAIQSSLRDLGEFVGADRSHVFEYDFQSRTARNTHEWCADGIQAQIKDLQAVGLEELKEITHPHRRGQPFCIAEVASHPGAALREVLLAQDIRSLVTVPLMMDGECSGFVGFDYVRSTHPSSKSEIRLLSVFAQMLGNMRLRQQVERQLASEQQRLRDIIAGTGAGTWEWDLESDRLQFNRRWAEMLGLDSAEALPQSSAEWFGSVHPEDAQTALAQLAEHLKGERPQLESEIRVRHADGRWLWILIRGRVAQRASDGRAHLLSGIMIDIHQRKQSEARLRTAASVFTHSGEGILVTDAEARIVQVNDAFTRITGYAREEVLGSNPSVLSSGRQDASFYRAMWHEIAETGSWTGEIWNRRRNGSEYAQRLTISTVRDGQGQPIQYVGLFADVTAQKNYERELERMAHFDSLTGLPNRILLGDRLSQAMSLARRNGERITVAYIDLDDFKIVNDHHGHQAGDQVLRQVARRFAGALRETDTVARPGGDEFVAILTGLSSDLQVRRLLQRLLDEVNRPIRLEQGTIEVGLSIGVTFYPQAGQPEADQLLRQADQAMLEAKRKGRNEVCYYDAELEQAARRRFEQQLRLRQALEGDEFTLFYQPQVALESGAVTGVEALIRWQHPHQGLLPPGAFLPLIQDPGLAADLGQWVLQRALRDLAHWHREGLSFEVAVNVSAAELLGGDFPDRLRAHLEACPDVPPERLLLEVVETSMLEDVARTNEVTRACHHHGVNFALDDFGTGFSSLSHLKHLPLKQLKIDRSFVSDMMADPDDLAIVEAVINLGRAFGLEVLAEGVEDQEHVTALRQLGCGLAQGYLIARPMPATEIRPWIEARTMPAAWGAIPALGAGGRLLLFAEAELRARQRWLEQMLDQAEDQPAQAGLTDKRSTLDAWLAAQPTSPHHGALEAARNMLDNLERQMLECCRGQRNRQARAAMAKWLECAQELLQRFRQLRTGPNPSGWSAA